MQARCPHSGYVKRTSDSGVGQDSRESRRQEVWGWDPCCPPGWRDSFSSGPTGSHPSTAPPTTAIRGDASSKLGHLQDSDSLDPCLAFYFHQFPQQAKESLDHLPLAETFFYWNPASHNQPSKASNPCTATGIMTRLSANPPPSPQGCRGCFLTEGGGWGGQGSRNVAPKALGQALTLTHGHRT